MTTHFRKHVPSHGWKNPIECGYEGDLDRESGHSYTAGLHLVTCHKCLEALVATGEAAVARIVALDLAAAST